MCRGQQPSVLPPLKYETRSRSFLVLLQDDVRSTTRPPGGTLGRAVVATDARAGRAVALDTPYRSSSALTSRYASYAARASEREGTPDMA